MGVGAEEVAVLLQSQNIGVGIHTGCVQLIQADQRIAHLVRGVGKHQYYLFCAGGNTAQANGETVTGENGEDDTDGLTAQLGADIGSNGIDGGVIALRTGDNRFRDSHNVTVIQAKAFALGSVQHAVYNDLSQVIAFSDNGAADAARSSSDFSFHILTSFLRQGLPDRMKGNPQIFHHILSHLSRKIARENVGKMQKSCMKSVPDRAFSIDPAP